MFGKKLLYLLISSFILCSIIGKIFDHFYKKRWYDNDLVKVEECLNGSADYDIIFFGNSMTHSGINPYIIDSVTNLNSYNFGFGNGDEQEMNMLCNIYMQQHKAPRLAILCVDGGFLIKRNALKKAYRYLLYLQNKYVYQSMKHNGFKTGLIKYLPFTKYSFFDDYNRTSIFKGERDVPGLKPFFYKGFMNYFPNISTDTSKKESDYITNVMPENSEILPNDTSIKFIDSTIKILLNHKVVPVFLFIPPRDHISPEYNTSNAALTTIAQKNGIKIISFEKDTSFYKYYYTDDSHFNKPGSDLFSLKLGQKINLFLKEISVQTFYDTQ